MGGRSRANRDDRHFGSIIEDNNVRDSLNFTLAKLKENTILNGLKIESPGQGHRRQIGGMGSAHQSSTKIKTLEAFLTSRRSSSKDRIEKHDTECPTTKRRLYLKEKPESPQNEAIESPDFTASRDPDSYSNRQLANLMLSLRKYIDAKDDRIYELERENERLRSIMNIQKQ